MALKLQLHAKKKIPKFNSWTHCTTVYPYTVIIILELIFKSVRAVIQIFPLLFSNIRLSLKDFININFFGKKQPD